MKIYTYILFFGVHIASVGYSESPPILNCPPCCPQTDRAVGTHPEDKAGATPEPTGEEVWNSQEMEGPESGCPDGYYKIRHSISAIEYEIDQIHWRITFCNGDEEGCDKMETYEAVSPRRKYMQKVPAHTRPFKESDCIPSGWVYA